MVVTLEEPRDNCQLLLPKNRKDWNTFTADVEIFLSEHGVL